MIISPKGIDFIKDWERLFLRAYDDATERFVRPGEKVHGVLTIGWGHTSDAGPPEVYVGMEVTEDWAEEILLADLMPVEHRIDRLVKVPLKQNQYDALVSFEYNTGWLEHPHCSLLSVLNSGNYDLWNKDFMLYDRARGHVMKGLTKRRKAEMEMFHGEG
jgi:lysozyme